MCRNLLQKTWFVEMVSAIIWAVIFIVGETVIAYWQSAPFPSLLEIFFKFLFLSFWFWVFFSWLTSKREEVACEYAYQRRKGKEGVERQRRIEEDQKGRSYGPRRFRRKTLGLK